MMTLSFFLIRQYDCTLYELDQLMTNVILNANQEVVDEPLFEFFTCDV